ncbi:unnamed protein product [Lactuca saligna]|uniref:Uncharacterized protein n=1 Tax=Lactuca saligna TaxID=75948 RepID=A0AA35VEV5_LACSI|nr:unnamed protein product [Lactuca saligna]
METTDPLIQDLNPPNSTSPSPQAITQSLGERLTKVEKDVAEIKHFITLGDDDDYMFTEDTPPNSPGDNPSPPPPSSNPHPPPPPPFHPPPHTPFPSSGSPTQTNDAKKGENSQESNYQKMVTATTPYLPEMYESGRDDNQKEIIVAEQERNIPDVDATNND